MTKYQLINPHIEGTLNTTFTGKDHYDAANQAWDALSKYTLNNVPQFAFTLENVEDGCLCHFKVQEKESDKKVKYSITKLNLSTKNDKAFKNKLESFKTKQSGGKKKHKKHDDDDSSSSSDSDVYDKILYRNLSGRRYPISYVWYDPLIYNLDYVVTPTWVLPGVKYIPQTVYTTTWTYYSW